MKQKLLLLSLLVIVSSAISAQPSIVIEPYLDGLTRPIKITHAYDDRLFVAEIGGKIKIVKNDVVLATPFLDIGSKVNDPEWAGIFSMTFDPNYQSNGYFYVMYVVKNKTEVQISRFQRSGSSNSDIAAPQETPILTIPYTDVFAGHRGGDMAFGKDNKLYISTGDNGPGSRGVIGDPENNSQNLNKLFGKLLKIDPNNPPSPANATQSIWALGLRNPWRFSFDKVTGDIWIGDNGQDGWEEINFFGASNTSSSRNFGWDYMEGNAVYRNCNCNTATSFVSPKLTYPGYTNNANHTGASVMGGYVYRGSRYPSLKGTYFYGDYQSYQIGAIVPNGFQGFIPGTSYPSLVSFGEDNQGELYVASFFDGKIARVTLPGRPLPVRLETFTAKKTEEKIDLLWRTSAEINFSHFELEHSTNGKNFQILSSISGSGANHNYQYRHDHPVDGQNYYRLKMVDNDGSYQISHLVHEMYFTPGEITVFPNPAFERFTVIGVKPGTTLKLYSISGSLILVKKITSQASLELNLKGYESGTYNLHMEDRGTGFVKKLTLIKQ